VKYFTELRQLYSACFHLFVDFVDPIAKTLRTELATAVAQGIDVHKSGFDLLQWLQLPETCPSDVYLQSAPISYPLIALTQLCTYWVALIKTKTEQVDVSRFVRCAFGHSQGVASAVVVACATTNEEFRRRATEMIRLLFWHGARVQQAHDAVSAAEAACSSGSAPEHSRDSKQSPMLSVSGLTPLQLKPFLAGTKCWVSLLNGATNCVVSGTPMALGSLFEDLERKYCSEIRLSFLRVSAAFHCPLLSAALPLIESDAERIGLTIRGEDLQLPVLSTADGYNLQYLGKKSILGHLIRMQVLEKVEWCEVLKQNFSGTTSPTACARILEFGPGGLHHIAKLTTMGIREMTWTGAATGAKVDMVGVSPHLDSDPSNAICLNDSDPSQSPKAAAQPPTTAASTSVQRAVDTVFKQWLPAALDAPDEGFMQLGADSLELTRISYELSDKLGFPVTEMTMLDFGTLSSLRHHLFEQSSSQSPKAVAQPPTTTASASVQRAVDTVFKQLLPAALDAPDEGFMQLGADSLDFCRISCELSEKLGFPVTEMTMIDFGTLSSLHRHLVEESSSQSPKAAAQPCNGIVQPHSHPFSKPHVQQLGRQQKATSAPPLVGRR